MRRSQGAVAHAAALRAARVAHRPKTVCSAQIFILNRKLRLPDATACRPWPAETVLNSRHVTEQDRTRESNAAPDCEPDRESTRNCQRRE